MGAADADAYYGYGYGHVVPVAYHVPNCTVEEKVVTVKQCTPKVEKKCEDVVYKSIKVTYVDECKDLVTKHCSDGTVETNEVEAGAGVEEERKSVKPTPKLPPTPTHTMGTATGTAITDTELTTIPSHRPWSLSSTTVSRPLTRPASPNPSPRRLRTLSPIACSNTAPTAKMSNTRFLTPSASEEG